MQAAARVPDKLCQSGLDMHMDVFEGRREDKVSAGDLALDLVEPLQDLVTIFFWNYPLRDQHIAVRPRRRDVVRIQTPIEVDGGIDALHNFVRLAAEAVA